MFVINSTSEQNFISFIVKTLIKENYKCNDLLIFSSADYIETFKKQMLQQSTNKAVIFPKIIILKSIHNSQLDIANCIDQYTPLKEIIIDDTNLSKYITASFCKANVNLKFLNNYISFIKCFLECMPFQGLDRMYDSLLELLKSAIGIKNSVYKITENLFGILSLNHSFPAIIAQKYILKEIENKPPSCNKLFLIASNNYKTEYTETCYHKIAQNPNCYLLEDSANSMPIYQNLATFVECESENEQQYVVYFIIRELIENGINDIALICDTPKQERYISNLLDKYEISYNKNECLSEQSYGEYFIKIFQVLSQEEITAIEFLSVLNHQNSLYLQDEIVTLLEKSYLRKPLAWLTLEDLLKLIKEKDIAIKKFIEMFIELSNLLKVNSFKELINNHITVFKKCCSSDCNFLELENLVGKIAYGTIDFKISADEYQELLNSQLKCITLDDKKSSGTVKFINLEKALYSNANAYIITSFNEGIYPPNFTNTNLISKIAETKLGLPTIQIKQNIFEQTLKKSFIKKYFFITTKNF